MSGQPLPEDFDPDETLWDIQLTVGVWPWRGDGGHLALLVGWLDQWLKQGGALPIAWTPGAAEPIEASTSEPAAAPASTPDSPGRVYADGTRVLEEIDHATVAVAGYAVYVREIRWSGGGASFDVYRAFDGVCLTEDESEYYFPRAERIAELIAARGAADCGECGNTVPDGLLISRWHDLSCSLHPHNTVAPTNPNPVLPDEHP